MIPPGGRVVLIRENIEFDQIINKKIIIEDALKSDNPVLKKLCRYFIKFQDNNLRINPSTSFELEDL